jgi:hypothetical protein
MKLVLGFLVIAVVAYLGLQIIPPYWANYQFEDAIKTEALISTNSSKTESEIRDSVFKKVTELEIPLKREDIRVQRTGNQGSGSVTIEAPYDVHVDLPGYSFDLHFDATTTNKGIF